MLTKDTRRRGERLLITDQMTLHEPKMTSAVMQLSYMEQQSESLLGLLDVLIERTYAAAPKRTLDFCLKRPRRTLPKSREALLERAIWEQWNHVTAKETGRLFPGTPCQYIQTFQMPLQAGGGHANDKYWGEIDLVGVSDSDLPVVFELKTAEAEDTPLRMLVEGLAYAIALRRAWNEGALRDKWKEARQSQTSVAPAALAQIPVVGIAPVAYWDRKFGLAEKSGRVPKNAWPPFRALCRACAERGFPIVFHQFEVNGYSSKGLPVIEDPTLVERLA